MDQRVSFFDAIEENKRNTIILMIGIFLLFVAMIWAFSYVMGLDEFGVIIGVIALAFYVVIIWFTGDKMVLMTAGARKVTREEQPFIHEVVEGLSIAARIPKPDVYLIQDDAPNAFATGRDPKHAAVAVTSGLLKTMKREELEGVLAHEISHIANYDIRLMMIAVVFAGAIVLISNITWRAMRGGVGRGNGGGKKGGGTVIILIIAIALLILSPIFAEIIRLAISRQREYLADANAAKLTRYPEGLASALLKIGGTKLSVKNATDATAPLYISNPAPNKFMHFFSTHPPIPDRVARLRAM